jgi:hypothetical protein
VFQEKNPQSKIASKQSLAVLAELNPASAFQSFGGDLFLFSTKSLSWHYMPLSARAQALSGTKFKQTTPHPPI